MSNIIWFLFSPMNFIFSKSTLFVLNVGIGFPKPNGFNSSIIWKNSYETFWIGICLSISIIFTKSSSFSFVFANLFIFFLNNSKFFIPIVNPAAPECPPNFTKSSGIDCNASKILKFPMLRHDPTAIPSSSFTSMIIAGL